MCVGLTPLEKRSFLLYSVYVGVGAKLDAVHFDVRGGETGAVCVGDHGQWVATGACAHTCYLQFST